MKNIFDWFNCGDVKVIGAYGMGEKNKKSLIFLSKIKSQLLPSTVGDRIFGLHNSTVVKERKEVHCE